MPICVATFVFAAVSRMRRASQMLCVSGFSPIHVLAVLEREHRGKGMRVLAGAHHHGVDPAAWSKSLRKSVVCSAVGYFFAAAASAFSFTSQRATMFLRGHAPEIRRAPAPGADDRNIEFVVQVLAAEKCGSGEDCARGGEGTAREFAAGEGGVQCASIPRRAAPRHR